MESHKHIENVQDLLAVIATNGIVYIVGNYGTPIISFFTACISLYYVIRKVKKEFFNE
jgi:hypothetical protein